MIRTHRAGMEVDRYSAASDRAALDLYQQYHGPGMEDHEEEDRECIEAAAQRLEHDVEDSR